MKFLKLFNGEKYVYINVDNIIQVSYSEFWINIDLIDYGWCRFDLEDNKSILTIIDKLTFNGNYDE